MRDDKIVVEVYNLAKIFAPRVVSKYQSRISADDLVQEFIANFMEKDFGARFDAGKATLTHFVWTGLRNTLVSQFRKDRSYLYNETEISNGEGDKISVFELIPDNRSVESMFSDMLKEEILSMITDTPFGYGNVVEHAGDMYASSVKSIVKLFLDGLTVTQISERFGVTAARVGQLLREAVLELPQEVIA